ncbi:hypothetical protein M405DRAFT_859993 [Rhizopogon salebrosus TDB-379]|nr:hypothetical protein M405DRAFT_859993 [Rhizopogon salebrosus TDB-379]
MVRTPPPRIVEHTVGARPFVAMGRSLFEDGPPLRERLSTQSAFFADSVPRSPSGRIIRASTADSVFDPGSRFPRRLERHAYYYLWRFWASQATRKGTRP